MRSTRIIKEGEELLYDYNGRLSEYKIEEFKNASWEQIENLPNDFKRLNICEISSLAWPHRRHVHKTHRLKGLIYLSKALITTNLIQFRLLDGLIRYFFDDQPDHQLHLHLFPSLKCFRRRYFVKFMENDLLFSLFLTCDVFQYVF